MNIDSGQMPSSRERHAWTRTQILLASIHITLIALAFAALIVGLLGV